MKILFVIDSLNIGGAEKLTVDIIKKIHDVHTVGIYVLKTQKTFLYEDVLSLKNVKIYCANISLYSPLHIFNIAKLAKLYDVVHVNLFPALYWGAAASVITSKHTKFIYTEHSSFNKRREHSCLRILEKVIYRHYHKIVAISEGVKKSLSCWIGQTERIITINNGVDLQNYINATEVDKRTLGITREATIIFMSARFNAAKDQSTLIRALKLIPDKKINLVLAGDGPLRKDAEMLVKNLNLTERVHFLGFRNDIPNLIQTSDICVLSSNWEGFGLVAVEYMAAGKPVIVSDVEGLNDIVRNAGLLFRHGDEEDLAEKIEMLVNDKHIYKDIAIKCKARSKYYDINKMIQSYLHLYLS